jgi:hypothetical protein
VAAIAGRTRRGAVRIALLRHTDEPQSAFHRRREGVVAVAAQWLAVARQRAAHDCHRAAKLRAKHGASRLAGPTTSDEPLPHRSLALHPFSTILPPTMTVLDDRCGHLPLHSSP